MWTVLALSTVFLLGFAEKTHRETILQGIVVSIDRTGENFFVNEKQVETLVSNFGYVAGNTYIDSVDISKLETTLEGNPFINDSEVYTTLNGTLRIDVEQRKPILRIFSQNGESFYIDENGWVMPLSPLFTSRVPIANGNIQSNLASVVNKNIAALADTSSNFMVKQLGALFKTVEYISNDPFWKAQFNQLFVNADREIELIPRVGDHRIIIGNEEDLAEKLNKLMVFYEKGLSKTGWNEYSVINLKFKNQVVCSKR